jgi:hypothetical protein
MGRTFPLNLALPAKELLTSALYIANTVDLIFLPGKKHFLWLLF